ncbi:hypothetical protein C8R44DRAFT_753937 [Mycena epipterygia]|nr:hypothetical protein C8R44DRAFT_753937 [Mycena epipterygia]
MVGHSRWVTGQAWREEPESGKMEGTHARTLPATSAVDPTDSSAPLSSSSRRHPSSNRLASIGPPPSDHRRMSTTALKPRQRRSAQAATAAGCLSGVACTQGWESVCTHIFSARFPVRWFTGRVAPTRACCAAESWGACGAGDDAMQAIVWGCLRYDVESDALDAGTRTGGVLRVVDWRTITRRGGERIAGVWSVPFPVAVVHARITFVRGVKPSRVRETLGTSSSSHSQLVWSAYNMRSHRPSSDGACGCGADAWVCWISISTHTVTWREDARASKRAASYPGGGMLLDSCGRVVVSRAVSRGHVRKALRIRGVSLLITETHHFFFPPAPQLHCAEEACKRVIAAMDENNL